MDSGQLSVMAAMAAMSGVSTSHTARAGMMYMAPPKPKGLFMGVHKKFGAERPNVGYSQGAPIGGCFNSSRRKRSARQARRISRSR